MGIERKEWLNRKSKKFQKKKYHENKIKISIKFEKFENFGTEMEDETYNDTRRPEYIDKAPAIFSFIENTQETIEYFNKILIEIEAKKFKQKFFIDSLDVVKVTTDVLAYIIAIINNVKLNKIMKYTFSGNLPELKEAQRAYLESGFFNYVKSMHNGILKSNSKIQIVSGYTTDQKIAKQICLFVIEKLKKDRHFTNVLFKTLIEMMSNSVHHAYKEEELMNPCWYLCAEHFEDKVQFVFIDTGYGIANTVRKKFWEKLGIKNFDSDLIYSAFNGEFRTETKLKNRGLGLPALMKYVIENEFDNFFVLSGKGSCTLEHIEGNNILTKNEYNYTIYGTIYVFGVAVRR